MSRIIILRHNGGRLGNQLLLYMSVYAFCLEMGYECINYSFYNYRKYFDIPTKDLYMYLFDLLGNLKLYKTHSAHLLVYFLYKFFSYIFQFLNKGIVIKEDPGGTIYLPPTPVRTQSNRKIVNKILNSNCNIFYIDGWNFRNPTGMKKYHRQIKAFLKPKKEILKKIDEHLKPLKDHYVIGVHIRQGDYKVFQDGKLFFTEKEVFQILKNFLKNKYSGRKRVHFIICSDGPINLANFKPLNVSLSHGSAIEDLFLLSMCKMIIGSDSTFGAFASYYGNIPFITFNRK